MMFKKVCEHIYFIESVFYDRFYFYCSEKYSFLRVQPQEPVKMALGFHKNQYYTILLRIK